MKSLRVWTTRLELFSGAALWLLIGTSQTVAYGGDVLDRARDDAEMARDRSVMIVAQFLEPGLPPVAPPPVAPPVQPPKVFQPAAPPPDVQANAPIEKTTSAADTKKTTEKDAAAKARREAEERAAAEAAAALKAAVTSLQQLLTDLGFAPGGVDGLMGKNTKAAVEDWIAGLDTERAEVARALAAASDWAALTALMSEIKAERKSAFDQVQLATGGGGGSGGGGSGGSGGAGSSGKDHISLEGRTLPVVEADPDILALAERLETGEFDVPGLDDLVDDGVDILNETAGMVELASANVSSDDQLGNLRLAILADRANQLEKSLKSALENYTTYKAALAERLADYPNVIAETWAVVMSINNNAIDWANKNIDYANKRINYHAGCIGNNSDNCPHIYTVTDKVKSLEDFNKMQISYYNDRIKEYQGEEFYSEQLLYGSGSGVDTRTLSKYRINVRYGDDAVLDTRDLGYFENSIARLKNDLENSLKSLNAAREEISKFQARRAEILAEFGGTSLADENKMDELENSLKDVEQIVQADEVDELVKQAEDIAKPDPEQPEPDDKIVFDPGDPGPTPTPDPGGPDSGGPDGAGPDSGGGGPDGAGPGGGGGGASDPEFTAEELAAYQVDLADQIDTAQQNIDFFIESRTQAEAELASLMARTDISAEQKAEIRDSITSRIQANEVFLKNAQSSLAALGAEYDGYQGKDFSDFNPYALNGTDAELIRISEKAKASERFYEELQRARQIIDQTADDMDAITLNQRVTDISNRVTDNAESYEQLAKMLHNYSADIRVTRQTGELEYMQAMAEDALLAAERDLAYAESVVATAKKAEVALMLGGAGYIAVTGGGAAALTFLATTQPVMAGFDAATSGLAKYDEKGNAGEAVAEGVLQGAKYYLPINTLLTLRDDKATKTDIALAVVADLATAHTGYNALKTQAAKTAAAQAKVTKLTLSPTDQAISKAAQAAAAEGDELAAAYKASIRELEAMKVTGSAAEIAEAESRVKTLIKAIDSSDEAKLVLLPQEQAISKAARAAAAEGDELVYAYKSSIEELDAIRATGSASEIAEVEDRIKSLVKAIDSSDEAKLALKTKSADLQAQYVTNQSEMIKEPANAIWKENMKAMGWSEEALETASIRNTSSAGTVGLDDDIRLLEPTLLDEVQGVRIYENANDPLFKAAKAEFNASLTKNGQKATLAQWQADAQASMEKAYQEVAGYSAKDAARVQMTTSEDIEAFRDIGLLDKEISAGSVGWSEQSASVTQAKVHKGVEAAEAIGLGDSSPMGGLSGEPLKAATTEIKVASREVLKDLVGKALEVKGIKNIPAQTDRQIKILQGIVDGTYDVAVANKLLLRETGVSLAKTLDSLSGHFEVILKTQ